jgi:general secretion pathway protein A
MYAQYFGLRDNPFTITPNPRYLYLGARHSEALAHLIYGVTESSGFIQLTGEVGTGKTLLIRSLLEQLPDHVDVALIVNPQMTLAEFLQSICLELDVPVADGASGTDFTRALNEKLLEAHANGRRVVLIVDEAQNLPRILLELVRLLTNLKPAPKN